jgi:hypothetical protein
MAKKKTAPPDGPSLIDPALIAILAAILWPDDFSNGRTAEAIRRAQKLIESVPDYLRGKKTSPGQSEEEAFQDFCLEIDRRMEEAREWGLAEPWSGEFYQKSKILPEGVFTFDQAIAQKVCPSHKTLRGLEQFLRGVNYPEILLRDRVITEFGYQRALLKQKAARREADRKRKRQKRSQGARSKSAVKPG